MREGFLKKLFCETPFIVVMNTQNQIVQQQ